MKFKNNKISMASNKCPIDVNVTNFDVWGINSKLAICTVKNFAEIIKSVT